MHNSRQLSRRRFLKRGTALGAGGLAAPYIIPSGVLGAPGRPGANERIGIGYVGVGNRGRQLMRLPKQAQIVAVSDVYLTRCREVVQQGKWRIYQDYRKMLEARDVDAVIVATPDHWHALPTIDACRAGKDAYCEKPLSLTIREGRAMVEAARKYKRVVQTGSQQRSMPANRIACELVRQGRIGKVHTVIGTNHGTPRDPRWFEPAKEPVPEGLDWDMWCGQTKLVPYRSRIYKGWAGLRPYSGGGMTGWGSHGFDQVQWALGTDDTGPVEVWVEGKGLRAPVHFRYANGVLFKLGDAPVAGAVFIGDQGRITIDRGKFKTEPEAVGRKALKTSPVRQPWRDNHMANWLECIRTRRRPNADVEIGHRTCVVCHLGNIARWVGRTLRWDPKKETFPGDDEANALLARVQRKPYELPKPV